MMGFFARAKPERPATVPTDTIIPMFYFDDNSINRSVLLYVTLRFDDVLDPERLRQSLERLMELGDWRKLGARVRKTDAGKLEYHVPAAFDAKRPGFAYTHVKHNMSIEKHPLASRIPRPTNQPSMYTDLNTLADLARRSDGPKKLDDFLYSDEPQLSLHIVSFEDATLVSISWLHTFLDATAMAAVLNAWVLVLNGREAEVPPICNFDTDPLASLGAAPTEPYVLAKRQLSGFNMVIFSLRYIFELVFYRDSQRVIYIPAHHLQAMKIAALQDIGAKSVAAQQDVSIQLATPYSSFLSDGDILCAFITRLAVKHLSPTSSSQIGMLNAFDLRPVLSSSGILPAAKVCLSNAVSLISTLAPTRDILTKPLGFTASLVRRSIIEHSTREQVEALAAITRRAVDQTGRPAVFGDGWTRLVIFSNWTKAGFFELDFGRAVIGLKQIEGYTAANQMAKPTFVNLSGEAGGLSPRGSWPILGREQHGGYWIQGNMRNDLWRGVEQELTEMSAAASQQHL